MLYLLVRLSAYDLYNSKQGPNTTGLQCSFVCSKPTLNKSNEGSESTPLLSPTIPCPAKLSSILALVLKLRDHIGYHLLLLQWVEHTCHRKVIVSMQSYMV